MENKIKELLQALKLTRRYMSRYDEAMTQTVHIPPAQRLRNQADEMEQEERDIEKIDEIIRKFEEQLIG